MRKEELINVFAYAEVLWAGTFKRQNDEKQVLEVKLWYDFLKAYDLNVIYAGMRQLAEKSDFCNIAKVANECENICNILRGQLTEDDIFLEIDKAISIYDVDENFNKLSDIAKKVVGSPSQLASWGQCDINSYNTVIASNIRRSIRNNLAIKQKNDLLKTNNNLGLCDNKLSIEMTQ